MSQTLRIPAILLALAMLATACGQKDGVGHQVGFAPGEPGAAEEGWEFEEGVDPEGFEFDPFEGDMAFDPDDPDAPAPGTPGNGTAPGAPGRQQPTNGGAAARPGDQQQQQQQQQEQQTEAAGAPTGGDSTGITADEIRIGVHAPLSGAAPLPQPEFRSGSTQYWDHHGQVHGRNVRVFIADDRYNPSHAVNVCNDLIQRQQVFTLIGGGGVDQIVACARTAAQQGVPYLSAGVDEGPLRGLPNYFALSKSYPQQGPMVVQYIMRNHRPDNGRLGIIRDRTPGFNSVVEAVQREAEAAGLDVHVRQHQNGPSDAQWITTNQLSVVFPIMAPSQFVQIVRSPGGAVPQYVGVGITMGLNTVAGAACEAGNPYKGMFLSPFPGLNQIDNLDPDFSDAGGQGDIELALWGLNKTIATIFSKMDANNLTREAFVHTLQTQAIETNVYPELRHTADDHFQAQSAHVLVADCSRGQYVTPNDGLFVSGF